MTNLSETTLSFNFVRTKLNCDKTMKDQIESSLF